MSKLSFKLLFFVQIFQLFFAVNLLFAPVPASAADPVKLKLEVPINVQKDAKDTYDFKSGEIDITKDKSTRAIAEYVKAIYKYGIGAVGIVSAIILMIGGLIWLTAGGSSERISEAKSYIGSSLMGLIIAILAYSILNTINPALVNFKIKEIQNVEGTGTGCCEMSEGMCQIDVTKNNCKGIFKEGRFTCTRGKCIQDMGGCCMQKTKEYYTDYYGCYWTTSKAQCISEATDTLHTYKIGVKCNTISGCPQFGTSCDGTNNGKSCGTNGICWEGICESCEVKDGICSYDICCEGLCCDDTGLNECVVGQKTNGNYCK